MKSLPYFQSPDRILSQLQTKWKAALDTLLQNPSLDSSFIQNVSLAIGNNVINHGLGRTQQGWRIADIDGASAIYRSQPFNDMTLTLNSSVAVTVSLEVF